MVGKKMFTACVLALAGLFCGCESDDFNKSKMCAELRRQLEDPELDCNAFPSEMRELVGVMSGLDELQKSLEDMDFDEGSDEGGF